MTPSILEYTRFWSVNDVLTCHLWRGVVYMYNTPGGVLFLQSQACVKAGQIWITVNHNHL